MHLLDPSRPGSVALLAAALLLLGGGWAFFALLEDVLARDPLILLDRAVFTVLQALRTSWLDSVMVAITELGSAFVSVPVIAVVAIVLATRRCWRSLGYWLAAMAFARLLVWAIKTSVGRARPIELYSGVEQFSFPSGRAASSIVLYGFLAFLLARGKSHAQKVAITLLAAVIVVLISFSRLYLGAHWMSDVLASLALGTAWIAMLIIGYTRHVRNERLPTRTLWVATLATMLAAGSITIVTQHRIDTKRYAIEDRGPQQRLPGWRQNGWRPLSSHRIGVEGEAEEPITVQWAGRPQRIEGIMSHAGWLPAPPWSTGTALLWMTPTPAPIACLSCRSCTRDGRRC